MPVENRVNKVLYNGDGTTKDFQFSFKIFKEENIVVSIVNADGTETTKTLGSDYSVSSDDFNLGGTVTMKVAPLATEKLFIIRSIPLVQDANFRPVSGFPEEVITDGFDAGIMIDQDLQEQIDRCLRAPSFVDADYTLPGAEAGKALIWDKDGKRIVNSDETINNVVAESTAQAQIATEKAVEASASASAAATSETNAKASESLAKDWAIEMDGTVDGTDYSAKYWAKVAEQGAYKDTAMLIGIIFSHTCSASFVPENSLPCDGSEYSKTQFANFYNNWLVGKKLNTCTYTEYQQDIATYGKCAKFGVDTINGKFKVPTIPDGTHIQQAMTDGELGKSYNAGLLNITGAVSGDEFPNMESTWSNGALYVTADSGKDTAVGDGHPSAVIRLDASRSNPIYGASDTVQGEAVSLRYFVVVATGSIKQSEMDWSAWASSLQGKANVDMDNLSTAGKAEIAELSAPSYEYIDLSTNFVSDGVVYVSKHTAPSDGHVFFAASPGSNDGLLSIQALLMGGGVEYETSVRSPSGTFALSLILRVNKGRDFVLVKEKANGVVYNARFIYTEGEI